MLRSALLQAVVLVLEVSVPVASAGGWMQTVGINQVVLSPMGSRRVLLSVSYTFKEARLTCPRRRG